MPQISYRGRKAVTIQSDQLRVTVLQEGGHIAEVRHRPSGVNPLWTPDWPSIEPSTFDPNRHAIYGTGADGKLLAGIMGHNLCLDLFGGPSPEEAAAGITVHGEASVAPYEISETNRQLLQRALLPLAGLQFERRIELHDGAIRICETVENLSASDRPIAWTQHVTLGPPFLERGATEFRASATCSRVFEGSFGSAAYLRAGADFDWPMAPLSGGGFTDLNVFNRAPVSSAFTTHLMDPRREHAFFVAFAPAFKLAFGYVWKPADFPWMGIWEENHSRASSPWNGNTLTRGMEFGVSPMPETRREMIDRGHLFGVPTYRWLPAKSRQEAEYWVVARSADSIPESLESPS